MKNKYAPPIEVFQELFVDMHESKLWPDGKAISDAIPKSTPEIILTTYRQQKETPNFDLETFVGQYFEFTSANNTHFKSDTSKNVEEHIEILWKVLKREADKVRKGSSLIPLPSSYIVPGGRFNEIYYWDSYFTMLGLQVSGHIDIIENMVDNFSYLIDEIGFIPNGNRTYFTGRSQPPFYALMVSLLAEEKGDGIFKKYLPFLEKEYQFWMTVEENGDTKRTITLDKDEILNRYYDNFHAPRDEMYATDLECVMESDREAKELYLDLRAACESGWDFSCRWLRDADNLTTIHTTEIIPVDLNSLLYYLETMISKAHFLAKNKEKGETFKRKATTRKSLILKYCWNENEDFFMDYDFIKKESKRVFSLAGVYPLFFKIATQHQAEQCAKIISDKFLKPGGVVTTIYTTGQQWDAPNGWAPLQWMTIQGLRNYGFDDLANQIKSNWITLNKQVYQRTGKMLEKYNVENIKLLSGGGEYPVQDGFGWTNGVLLKLLKE